MRVLNFHELWLLSLLRDHPNTRLTRRVLLGGKSGFLSFLPHSSHVVFIFLRPCGAEPCQIRRLIGDVHRTDGSLGSVPANRHDLTVGLPHQHRVIYSRHQIWRHITDPWLSSFHRRHGYLLPNKFPHVESSFTVGGWATTFCLRCWCSLLMLQLLRRRSELFIDEEEFLSFHHLAWFVDDWDEVSLLWRRHGLLDLLCEVHWGHLLLFLQLERWSELLISRCLLKLAVWLVHEIVRPFIEGCR